MVSYATHRSNMFGPPGAVTKFAAKYAIPRSSMVGHIEKVDMGPVGDVDPFLFIISE